MASLHVSSRSMLSNDIEVHITVVRFKQIDIGPGEHLAVVDVENKTHIAGKGIYINKKAGKDNEAFNDVVSRCSRFVHTVFITTFKIADTCKTCHHHAYYHENQQHNAEKIEFLFHRFIDFRYAKVYLFSKSCKEKQ